MEKQYHVRGLKEQKGFDVEVPGSKSITNRALLLAAMGTGRCTLRGVLFSEDSRAFLNCLKQLGFELEIDEQEKWVKLQGTGGKVPNQAATINVGSAGTAARFLTVFLAFAGGEYVLDSSEQMKKRPMEPIIRALREAGVEITCLEEEYHFPFKLKSKKITADSIAINTDVSSQFASALLMAGAMLPDKLNIILEGERTEGAYIKITLRMLEQFGISYSKEGKKVVVGGCGEHYIKEYAIEPDVSAAGYFYAMAPLCGKTVRVKGVHLDAMQGDIQFVKALEKLGCQIEETEYGVRVTGSEECSYPGITINMKDFSDQTMTMAVLAPFAKESFTITGIGHIRYQESDRLHAILSEMKKMGISCEELQDGDAFRIEPGKLEAAVIETYQDHRMAMAFSLVGLRTKGIVIDNPGCCAKTFENYFEVLDGLCEAE